jgi:hypothetical protein
MQIPSKIVDPIFIPINLPGRKTTVMPPPQGERRPCAPPGGRARRAAGPLIHLPWSAARAGLASAGVTLDGNYPAAIVDRKAVRERALAAYAHARQG